MNFTALLIIKTKMVLIYLITSNSQLLEVIAIKKRF